MFQVEKQLLIYAGYYPLKIKSFYYYFRFALTCIINGGQFLSLALEIVLRFNMNTILDVLYIFLTQASLISKLINFIINRKNVFVVEDIISTNEFRLVSTNTQKAFYSTLKSSKFVATWYRVTCICSLLFYAIFPILDSNSDLKTPLRSWYPFNEEKYRICIYVSQIISLIHSAYNNSAIDLLAVRLIKLGSAQFDVLKDKLVHFYDEDEDVFKNEEEKDDVLGRRLKQYVEHHLLILRFVIKQFELYFHFKITVYLK